MNSLERVRLTLQHKEADRVPVYPLLNSVSRKKLGINYKEWTQDVDLCAQSIIKTTDELDLDAICTLVDLSVEAADWGQEILYFEDKAACPSHDNRLIKSVEDYTKIKKINPRETPRMSEHIELCEKLVKARGKEKPIIGFVFGPLGIAGMLRGHDKLFMDLIDCSKEVHKCLREITETLKEFCTAMIEEGVHAIMFDTLFASKTIMSKRMWDKFEGVYMEELANHIRELGSMVMIHNCGAGPYFDVQLKRMNPIAFSFLHYPAECSSFEDMKEKYGDKLTLIGHVDPGWLMTATLEEVEEECKKEIDTFKKGGGFILATGCEYPAPLDFEKAKVMIKTAKEYGRY
ncbi:uroporphyrinogen decarboxylase family protein [Anaeromicrobium sediminis]|uniref:Uroporphyrinogen decarboxylase n=1 Tax=Anaeromicrobium sediminis TaxID=1478221 RepID=A0A267MNH9_9FIRM|nr:uroporphyrinogen decarboxylase family protein [Anaeromicrobium sediminis]PAB60478.1 uroporphyrinogen decarboxylase [Anaeromicrobium sediminis]